MTSQLTLTPEHTLPNGSVRVLTSDGWPTVVRPSVYQHLAPERPLSAMVRVREDKRTLLAIRTAVRRAGME